MENNTKYGLIGGGVFIAIIVAYFLGLKPYLKRKKLERELSAQQAVEDAMADTEAENHTTPPIMEKEKAQVM